MSLHERAIDLLNLARGDEQAMLILAASPRVTSEFVGFHAQQAVEKSLKAVLCHREVSYPWTHDIRDLLGLLKEKRIEYSSSLERCVELTPFAVRLRYDPIGSDDELIVTLDRAWAKQIVRTTIEWAEQTINGG